MKTLLFSILFSACSFFAMASTTPAETTSSMQKQLTEILQKSDFYKDSERSEVRIMVKFTFNENNEMIVLSTDNDDYDSSIKSLFNYKALDLDEDLTNKIFFLPIRVERK